MMHMGVDQLDDAWFTTETGCTVRFLPASPGEVLMRLQVDSRMAEVKFSLDELEVLGLAALEARRLMLAARV